MAGGSKASMPVSKQARCSTFPRQPRGVPRAGRKLEAKQRVAGHRKQNEDVQAHRTISDQESWQTSLKGMAMDLRGTMAQSIAAVMAAATIMLQPLPALADADLYRYPASSRPDILAVQKTLLEVWAIVKGNFVDANFNGHNWDRDLGSALMSAYDSPDGATAYDEIRAMVHGLGDPYTRIIPPSEFADFTVTSNGEMQGVGMLIAADTKSGRLMVVSPLDGSPAAKAGIEPGDEVVTIDGHSVHGWDGDKAASSLRGKRGSTVNIRLARRTQQVPGIAGRPDPPLYTTYRQVNVTREKLELSPVYSTALMHDDHKVGYLRLTNFSQKAAADVKRHLIKLEKSGAEAFILDLRNNPGGLVRSGLDVARIFLDGPTTIFNVAGREPADLFSDQLTIQQKVILEDGHSDTRRPLAVLVNHNSASASEILAGALRDNHRAVVLGDRTYGKGKIQSVFELSDGSALFVTVARYRTPLLAEIDQVGIQPDESCRLDQDDESGMPQTVQGALMIANQLVTDQCVIKAEERLEAQLLAPQELHWLPESRTWAPDYQSAHTPSESIS